MPTTDLLLRDRRWATALATATICLLSGPSRRSPDGVEMIATAFEGWTDLSPGYWPPVWPTLAALLGGEAAGHLLNLACAGGTAWFVHALAARWGGRFAALLAVVIWACLPATSQNAAVLDARPMGWLCMAAGVEFALRGDRRALLISAVAPLVRPEGVLVGAAVSLLARSPWGLLSALPGFAWVSTGRAWERWLYPWVGVWPTGDLLALYGFASAPTPFREWVVANGEAPGPPWGLILAQAPASLHQGARGLLAAIGGSGVVLALAGVAMRRSVAVLALLVVPFLAVSVAPQSQGQLTGDANMMFFAPLWIAASAGVFAHVPWIAAVWLVEGWAGPWRALPAEFMEGTPVAAEMAAWLREHPPVDGKVRCTFSGRSVVRDAGLEPLALPSPWDGWEPAPGAMVIVGSVDARGTDGGGVLELLEDRNWELVGMVSEEAVSGAPPHWLAALRRR